MENLLLLKDRVCIINPLTLILSILLFIGVLLIYVLIFYQNKTFIDNTIIIKDFFTLKFLVIFLFFYFTSISNYLLLFKNYNTSFNLLSYTVIYILLMIINPVFFLYSSLLLLFLNKFMKKQKHLHFVIFIFIFIEIFYSYKFNIYILYLYNTYFKYYFLITQKFDSLTIINTIYSCNQIIKNSFTISYDLIKIDFEPQKFEILSDFIYNSYSTNIMIRNGNSILVFYSLFELFIIV